MRPTRNDGTTDCEQLGEWINPMRWSPPLESTLDFPTVFPLVRILFYV